MEIQLNRSFTVKKLIKKLILIRALKEQVTIKPLAIFNTSIMIVPLAYTVIFL